MSNAQIVGRSEDHLNQTVTIQIEREITYTQTAAQDLKEAHGVNIEDEILRQISNVMSSV